MPSIRSAATTTEIGQWGEAQAERYLCDHGLELVAKNFRGRRGEIDLIMRRRLSNAAKSDSFEYVFVEVRLRSQADYGGAAQSVSAVKQRRIRKAAEFYFLKHVGPGAWPACRFDVLAIEHNGPNWIQGAF